MKTIFPSKILTSFVLIFPGKCIHISKEAEIMFLMLTKTGEVT